MPVDHFHNDSLYYEPHSDEKFNLRYWFDATYYKDGGPVIVLQSGETGGVGRLGFLQKGLLHDLAVATNGIGVVHRYYGTSWPTQNLTTESLRYLITDQALADQAYFAQNVVYAGLEDKNLTASNTAYLAYGGSYAGAFVAFLRKLYPDVYWGAISSSGVTEAIWDYWASWEPIRWYADQQCIEY
ncbi:peptidase S28 [Leptodontidium sp. 2 PMI_412]|nr:peptidase S28 [Leptodontidium sp. 2 PMI_412]